MKRRSYRVMVESNARLRRSAYLGFGEGDV